MNIKITYNWLLDYLETDADPYELQKYLSLCGPSVESVEKIDDDFLLEIEVTSNRVDSASVLGIAQEAVAILPKFGKKALLKNNPLEKNIFPDVAVNNIKKLDLKVDSRLCPRFTALVLSNIKIRQSDQIISQRLSSVGIRPINNVVDISNYMMIAIGQPSHCFDFDKIVGGKMLLRESRQSEKISTLDGKSHSLKGGDIVIEDGSGSLIDLCGIMGGKNSQVTDQTKNVLLFVQTYDAARIRKTSMSLGIRTQAASYFEKDLDEERIIPSLNFALMLMQKHVGSKIASLLYDLYPTKYVDKNITITQGKIDSVMGVKIEQEDSMLILRNLGFKVLDSGDSMKVTLPSWRSNDVASEIDLIEEISRIYGYENLPAVLPPQKAVSQLALNSASTVFEDALKLFIKHAGFTETYTYSMISSREAMVFDKNLENYLKIANPISTDLKYMRRSLSPSMLSLIKNNSGKKNILKFFEISRVYLKKNSDLPSEPKHLVLATNTDFWEIKGMIESIFAEFSIGEPDFAKPIITPDFLDAAETLNIKTSGGVSIGFIGKVSSNASEKIGLKCSVYLSELDLVPLFKAKRETSKYENTSSYAQIKQDLNFELQKGTAYKDLIKIVKESANFLEKIEFLNLYNNRIALRLYFRSDKKNLTEKEVLVEIEKIKKKLNLPLVSHS